MDKQMQYIIEHQSEWREIYEQQRRKYKYEKGRAEKQRVKDRRNQTQEITQNTC